MKTQTPNNIDGIEFLLLDERENIGSYQEITSYWFVPDHGRFAVQSIRDRANDLAKTVIYRAVVDADGTTAISNYHELRSEPFYTDSKNGHLNLITTAVEEWENGVGMTANLWGNLS